MNIEDVVEVSGLTDKSLALDEYRRHGGGEWLKLNYSIGIWLPKQE